MKKNIPPKQTLKFILMCIYLLLYNLSFGQNRNLAPFKMNRSKIYIYWGWNKEVYSKSDIHFVGDAYDFTIQSVIADDRQSPFNPKIYFNPIKLTIPQYNFRIGYFINDKYNISLGVDHMKYVVRQEQTVKINGNIGLTGTKYDKNYIEQDIVIQKGFLKLEHTDGLNYINIDFRRLDELIKWKTITLGITEGVGTGFLIPRTDATLFSFERNDKFHVAGYGISGMLGLNVKCGKYFFIQSEYKMGYINMMNILTTTKISDTASQNFFFHQYNVVFGSYLKI